MSIDLDLTQPMKTQLEEKDYVQKTHVDATIPLIASEANNDFDTRVKITSLKLYRRYLVTYYPPLFDVYLYQEPIIETSQSLLSPENVESDVEVSVEDEEDSEVQYRYEALPKLLDRIHKDTLGAGFDTLLAYTNAIKKGEHALDLLEKVLTFKTEYLVASAGSEQKLSILGRSIMKQALMKISERAKYNSKILSGIKALIRINRYRNKQEIMRFWYRWKLVHARLAKLDTQELMEEESTVMNDSKKRIITSNKYQSVSRDFDQDKSLLGRQRISPTKIKIRRKDISHKKRMDNLAKYFSREKEVNLTE